MARVIYGLIAVLAVAGASYLAKIAWKVLTDSSGLTLVQNHAPAVLGLPIAVAIATAIVCGARALDENLRIEFLGFQAEAAGAAILGWVVVFALLVLALRGLW